MEEDTRDLGTTFVLSQIGAMAYVEGLMTGKSSMAQPCMRVCLACVMGYCLQSLPREICEKVDLESIILLSEVDNGIGERTTKN